MEAFVFGTLFEIVSFMKTHYAWGEITLWQASMGLFTVEGIYSAFRIGRAISDKEREEK